MKNFFFYAFIIIAVSGCVTKTKYNSAISTIDSLRETHKTLLEENEELKNGEERLVNLFKLNVKQGDYLRAQETYETLIKKHPESAQIVLLQRTADSIAPKAKILRDSIDKAIRDSIRLANIDDIGEWSIGDYVDDFGDNTGEHFVDQVFYGTFSNTATAGSTLKVTLRFAKSVNKGYDPNFYIYCDEYDNGTIDETSYGSSWKIICPETHRVYKGDRGSIRDQENNEYIERLATLLRQENTYEFTIWHDYKTVYKFSINAKGFENALLKAGIDSL